MFNHFYQDLTEVLVAIDSNYLVGKEFIKEEEIYIISSTDNMKKSKVNMVCCLLFLGNAFSLMYFWC